MNQLNETYLWTALVTPMNQDGQVNYQDLEALVREQEQAGNGLLILGSTGESLNLNLQEQKEVIGFVTGLKPTVPLMAGIGGINLESTLEWLKFLETLPIDCYLMVTPLYAKPGPKGQTHWFQTLLDHSTRPCMLYNVPSRTGTNLKFETVTHLQNHPRFWAIKEASGSVHDFAKYREIAPQVVVYSGDDGMTPYFCTLGAKGLVSVISNVWPKETNLYTKKCLEGKYKGLFPLWHHATDALFRVSNPIPAKRALFEFKRISSPTLRAPLIHTELESAQELNEVNERVFSWYQENK